MEVAAYLNRLLPRIVQFALRPLSCLHLAPRHGAATRCRDSGGQDGCVRSWVGVVATKVSNRGWGRKELE
jgi:hypothetical protein